MGHSISVHSTDEYFIQTDEEGIRHYVVDKKKLNEYHQNNQEAFKQALENRIDIVVCDNTNFESWQSKPYTDMAREFGYKILLIDFKNRHLETPMDYGWDVAQCIKKPRGIAKHYDYDFYLERVLVEPQDYEKQNRELSLKALEFLKYNFDFDVIFYSFGEQLMPILTRMLVSVSKSHRKRLENYGKDIKT